MNRSLLVLVLLLAPALFGLAPSASARTPTLAEDAVDVAMQDPPRGYGSGAWSAGSPDCSRLIGSDQFGVAPDRADYASGRAYYVSLGMYQGKGTSTHYVQATRDTFAQNAFRVYANATLLIQDNASAWAYSLSYFENDTSSNAWWAVIRITAGSTTGMDYSCNGPGAATSFNWLVFGPTTNGNTAPSYPPWLADAGSMLGYARALYAESVSITYNGPNGVLWYADAPAARLSEKVVVNTDLQLNPALTQGRTRLNTEADVGPGCSTSATGALGTSGAAPHSTVIVVPFQRSGNDGSYVTTTKLMFNNGGGNPGTGSVTIALSESNDPNAWTSAFLGHVNSTWTTLTGASISDVVTINWFGKTVTLASAFNGYMTWGTPTFYGPHSTTLAQNADNDVVLASFTTYYLIVNITYSTGSFNPMRLSANTACATDGQMVVTSTGGSGGTVGNVAGAPAGMQILAYGGSVTYTLQLDNRSLQGALELLLWEDQIAGSGFTTNGPLVSTSQGATATFGSYEAGTNGGVQYQAYRYRVAYTNDAAANASQALTITVTNVGKNYENSLTPPLQPGQTGHVQYVNATALAGSGTTTGSKLQLLLLWATDDYSVTQTLQVNECSDSASASLNNTTIPYAAYTITVPLYQGQSPLSGPVSRVLTGIANASGGIQLSGADLAGKTLRVSLDASNHLGTDWDVTVPLTAGTYAQTIGLPVVTLAGGSSSATLATARITFSGNTTRTIPDRVQINITRGLSVALFVGADHVDPTTGVLQHNVVRATVWDASAGNAFNFYYPTRTKSSAQDRGLYVLWVMNETGAVLNSTKYFLEPPTTSWTTDDATITSDVLASISENGYASAQQAFQQSAQASILLQQKSVREQVFEDFQHVHDWGGLFIALLGLLAVVRAFRR